MLCELVIRTFSTSVCLFVRGRNKFPSARVNRIANPGIQKQIDAYHEVEKDVNLEELNLEEMESDFMGADKLYDNHRQETKTQKEKIKLQIVKGKYFKNSFPSMLTWAEKEQIRYLHNQDSEEWCAEKLSQCFPATEDIIKKILKSKWQPKDADRVLKHDSLVEENWEKLKQGTLQIDPATKKHLKKFTQRPKNITGGEWMKNISVKCAAQKPKKSVFGQIISSYSEIKERSTQELDHNNATMLTSVSEKDAEPAKTEVFLPQKFVGKEAPNGDSFLVRSATPLTRQQPVTLKKYKEEILGSAVKQAEIDSSMVKRKSNNYVLEKQALNEQNTHLQQSTLESRDTFVSKIWIPREKKKKGGTYKVYDCYFDNDGSFLYRVPGMKK